MSFYSPGGSSGGATSLAGLTDSTISGPVKGQELVYTDDTPTKIFNISHKRNLRAYRVTGGGFKGDGVSDDSTVINQAISDAGLKGWVEYPPGLTVCQQNVLLASNVIIDGNDSTAKLVNAAAANADVFTVSTFAALIGGNTTGGIYRWKLQNIRIDGNKANNANGRHGIAVYGIGDIDNVIIKNCHGNALWGQWSATASQLSALGLADGDQTFRVYRLMAYDCDMAVTIPGADATIVGGITGVTNTVNPTITTAQYHLFRVGQTITISGVVGAVGVNGTWQVTSVTGSTTFTITTGAPGAYTSGGTITTPQSAMVLLKNMDSPRLRELEIYSTLSMVPGTVGLMLSCSGSGAQDIHIYQNFPVALDVTGGNNTRIEGLYVGGHDQAIRVRQNNVQIANWYIDGGFGAGVGFDYQSVGGGCHFLGGRVNGLPAGLGVGQAGTTPSVCYRIWNTSFESINVVAQGDGGSNTSIAFQNPNSATIHGAIYNNGNGVNAAPATLINFTS